MLCVCQQLASTVQNVRHTLLLLVTQATNLSLLAIKCCSVIFGVTQRFLVINISSSSLAINKLSSLLPAISVTTCGTVVRRRRIDNTWLRRSVDSTLRIAISAYPTCIRRPRQGIPVGILPCRLVWKNQNGLATRSEKKIVDMFLHYDKIRESDKHTQTHRQTDRHIPHDDVGRASIHSIARQKL